MVIFNNRGYIIKTLLFISCFTQAQQPGSSYPISPVPFSSVEITDSFWGERMEVNRKKTIPIAFQRSEESGRIQNFKVAAGIEKGTFNTDRGYDDSDVYKVMEGAAYSLIQHPDPELEKYLDDLISIVAKAQESDGYLFTVKTILGISDEHRDAKKPKWVEIEEGSHELYNVGHMYEAAVAHYKATGKRTFLDIAIKNADLIDKEFGWGKREIVPGHQEIEIGLTKLYVVTGDQRYLELAKFFLDKRGQNEHRSTYNQSHKKVIEQSEAVGHSVRAVYMYTAMADIAALTNDKGYINAMDKLWHDIVDTKMYIIGGIGAAGGHEGFGDHYELPNLRAYNETCAAIANVFWNYRLFLTHGDAKYMDVLERSLYNNVLSGVSLEGDKFFYPNRLESRGQIKRSEWFGTSCCPSNVARFIPDVPGYIYAYDMDGIYVNLFISSKTNFHLDGHKVKLEQKSQIPWSGKTEFNLKLKNKDQFAIRIRIPGWAADKPIPSDLYSFINKPQKNIEIKVNGNKMSYLIEKGYAVINREWNDGDILEVKFPYGVRLIKSNPNIKENTGKIALQAGPLVYCIEGFDIPDGNPNNIMIDKTQTFNLTYQKDFLNGLMTISGKAKYFKEIDNNGLKISNVNFTAIPYYAWANRGNSEMEVWIPYKEEYVFPDPFNKDYNNAHISTSKKERTSDLYLINDSYIPSNNPGIEVPDFNFWPLSKSNEWIQYQFDKPVNISKTEIYWAFKENEIEYPKSWGLSYLKNGKWIKINGSYKEVGADGKPSIISFPFIHTTAIKLHLEIGERTAGLYEWIVE